MTVNSTVLEHGSITKASSPAMDIQCRILPPWLGTERAMNVQWNSIKNKIQNAAVISLGQFNCGEIYNVHTYIFWPCAVYWHISKKI